MHRWQAIKFSNNSEAVKYYIYVLSNRRLHRLSQYLTSRRKLMSSFFTKFNIDLFDRD